VGHDGALTVVHQRVFCSRTIEGPWLRGPDEDVLALHHDGDTLIAWVETGTTAPPLSISSDFGATWRSSMPAGISRKKRHGVFADVFRPGRFYAMPLERGAKDLWRSDDGMRSWTEIAQAPLIAPWTGKAKSKPKLGCDALLTSQGLPDRLVSLDGRGWGLSDDGGRTWRALPGFDTILVRAHELWGLFGDPLSRKPVLRVQRFDGETWQDCCRIPGKYRAAATSPSGRLFLSVTEPNKTYASFDGLDWQPVADVAPTRIVCDPTRDDVVWMFFGPALIRFGLEGVAPRVERVERS
jgi:hypothetical protein